MVMRLSFLLHRPYRREANPPPSSRPVPGRPRFPPPWRLFTATLAAWGDPAVGAWTACARAGRADA